MKLSNVFQRLAKPYRESSTFAVLERLIGVQVFEKVIAITPDRRQVLAEVARQTGLPEDFILEQVSEALAVPLLRSVPEFDLKSLSTQLDLSELEKVGCAPIMGISGLRALACVDPFLAGGIKARFANLPIYLASWGQISTALATARAKSSEQPKPDKLMQVAHEVVQSIVREADSFGAYSCTILENATGLEYTFDTKDCRCARGEIGSRIDGQVRRLLGSLSRGPSPFLMKDGSPIEIEALQVNLHKFAVTLRWRRKFSQIAEDSQQSPQAITVANNVVRFPGACAASIANSSSEEAPLEQPKSPNALVVEDNKTFVMVLERFLARYEIVVRCKQNAEQALKYLDGSNEKIDLFLCDVHMPGMGGLEFVRKIRSRAEFKDTPIIMLTSDNDVELELDLLAAGADVFISKNEDPRILGIHIQKMVQVIRARRAA